MSDQPRESSEDFTEQSEGGLSDEFKIRILRRVADELEARSSEGLQPERMAAGWFESYDKA
jgi:hypothetical protein